MILIFIHIAIETSQYTVMNVLVESLNMETTCLCHLVNVLQILVTPCSLTHEH